MTETLVTMTGDNGSSTMIEWRGVLLTGAGVLNVQPWQKLVPPT